MFIRCINLVIKEILCDFRKKNLSQTLFEPKETVFVFLILYLIKFLFIFFTKVLLNIHILMKSGFRFHDNTARLMYRFCLKEG